MARPTTNAGDRLEHLSGSWELETSEREGRPVNYWTLFGAVCIVFQVGVFAAWMRAGNADPTPVGPSAVPDGMQSAATVLQAAGVIAALGIVGWVVVRPLVTERRLTTDAMLVLALSTVGWQIILPNYNQLTMTFNAHYVDRGSWGPWIPGWLPPNGHEQAVPLLWLVGVVIGVGYGAAVLGSRVMQWAQRRDARLGVVGTLATGFVALFVAAFALELAFTSAGVYSYAGGYQHLSLFAGAHDQLPIYQPVLSAAVLTSLAAIRYFKNPLGEIAPHRGLDRLGGGPVQRGLVRVVAIAGMLNVLVFLGWSLPSAALAVHSDEFPVDVLERSYLTNGLCGPNTEYHCPGPDIPIPRPDSAYITPDGQLGRP